MRSATRTLLGATMLAMVRGQGVVLSAVGDSGTSSGLQGELQYAMRSQFCMLVVHNR